MKQVAYGDTHSAVTALRKELTVELKKIGRDDLVKSITADDPKKAKYFGRSLETAVKVVQEKAGLDADGVVGPKTWGHLRRDNKSEAPAKPQPKPEPKPAVKIPGDVEIGDRGPDVARLRKELAPELVKFERRDLAKFITKTEQGDAEVFDKTLETCVKLYQRTKGLEVDGIVGPQTWSSLLGLKVPASSRDFKIIPTEVWGARLPTKQLVNVSWHGAGIRVHHTAGRVPHGLTERALLQDEYRVMRETQQFHQSKRGYSTIGYNYLIAPSGRIYEGRGFGVLGAHTLGHNEDCGISFIGDYTGRKLTQAQIDSFNALVKYLRAKGVSGPKNPHRATFGTSCPSDNVIQQLGL